MENQKIHSDCVTWSHVEKKEELLDEDEITESSIDIVNSSLDRMDRFGHNLLESVSSNEIWLKNIEKENDEMKYKTSSFKNKHDLNDAVENMCFIKEYKCNLCDSVSPSKHALQNHIETVHEGKRPFKCATCGFGFTEQKVLLKHQEVVHLIFKCTICNFDFSSSHNLEKHSQVVHKGERSELGKEIFFTQIVSYETIAKAQFLCKICMAGFLTRIDLNTHKSCAHGDIKIWTKSSCLSSNKIKSVFHIECKICTESFKSKYFLKKHIEDVHEKSEGNVCNNCSENFKSKYLLTKHTKNIKEISSEIKLCKKKKLPVGKENCKFCNERFKNKYFLTKHLEEVHDRNKHNNCENCRENFKSKWLLKKHIYSIKESLNGIKICMKKQLPIGKEKCTICAEGFKTKYFLTKHVKEAHEIDTKLKEILESRNDNVILGF